ncbi:VanZ family protein [Thalassiella azotivora]
MPPPAATAERTEEPLGRPTAWRVALALAVTLHLAVLYWPAGTGEPLVPHLDKAVHVLVFGAVALTWRAVGGPLVPVAGVLAAHAVVSEVVQHRVLADRTGDAWDVAADLLGVVTGLLLAGVLRPRRPLTTSRSPGG